jgi:hypothetical protein
MRHKTNASRFDERLCSPEAGLVGYGAWEPVKRCRQLMAAWCVKSRSTSINERFIPTA